jgi:predicted GIY-YIG superfamily endonuclease
VAVSASGERAIGPPWRSRLLEAASRAPTGPGVYFFLDERGSLLYVGKAKDVRQRLRQHARVEPLRSGRWAGHVKARYPSVRSVAWEPAATEADAIAREADLIVALRPPDNASTDTGTWTYLALTDLGGDRIRLDLDRSPPAGATEVYGCFPHLGRGVLLAPAVACSDGYAALTRLLWAASGDGDHVPAAITRSAPPRFETILAPGLRGPMRRLCNGTGEAVLDQLAVAVAGRAAYLQPALQRDRVAARGFYEHGPRALRRLRLRHDRPPGVLTRAEIEALLADELAPILGGHR